MGTFVLVTLDLKDGTSKNYQTAESWLSGIYLSRSIPHGASSVKLPSNTFAGVLNHIKTPAEAVAFVEKEVAKMFEAENLQGRAFVAASIAPEHKVLTF